MRSNSTPMPGPVRVVDDVSFDVGAGKIVGLVGESGCGKTVSSLAILRLLPTPPARIVGGSIRFDGQDLLDADFDELRQIRGRDIAMVFQDPLASLDPSFTVGYQLVEAIRLHENVSRAAARDRAARLLESVHIPDPARRLSAYPHQLSGGMRQRVMIAMALSCHPRLLIADEPTTALDVTVQAQIVELLRELRETDGAGRAVRHARPGADFGALRRDRRDVRRPDGRARRRPPNSSPAHCIPTRRPSWPLARGQRDPVDNRQALSRARFPRPASSRRGAGSIRAAPTPRTPVGATEVELVVVGARIASAGAGVSEELTLPGVGSRCPAELGAAPDEVGVSTSIRAVGSPRRRSAEGAGGRAGRRVL